ncbi:MAG: GNAT family N-acetyltransferase [Treponema sp.]
MFNMIVERVKWMDKQGIKQWNVTNYLERYPISYYEDASEKGDVFVLEDSKTNELICAGILLEDDERWNSDEPSFYIHNFVSKIGVVGIGSIFLKHVEEYAKEQNKSFLRLDVFKENTKMNSYYEKHGFIAVGTCKDGPYIGVLREKKL